MRLQKVSKEDWAGVSEKMHKAAFGEDNQADYSTISFALLVTDENDMAVAYSTIIDIDKHSAYMQHGGALPPFEKTIKIAKAYHLMLGFLKEHYSRITTRIKNTNLSMIKLAHSAELIINGMDWLMGELFLNFCWLRPEAKSAG